MRTPLLALLVLVVAACADGGGEPGAPASPGSASPSITERPSDEPSPSASSASGNPESTLTVVVDDGSGALTTWHLTCDPAGGDHPDPAAACEALARHGAQALPPVAPDRVCTQLYGGPQRATVSGTWRGAPVLSRLSLTNGCEISRWKALVGLLPPAGS